MEVEEAGSGSSKEPPALTDSNMDADKIDPSNVCPKPRLRTDEDIVIAGLSCRLPEADNLEEFSHNLTSGKDMVTEDDRRWPPGFSGLPKRNGKLKDLSRFDAEFFRVNPLQAHAMDPQLRILLEVVHEAMVDAGVSKSGPGRAKTGVFVGSMFSEALDAVGTSKRVGYGLTGAVSSMLSNYVSFCFDFGGPSITVNTSCSASLYALDLAAQSIRGSKCDSAIVAGTNIILNPGTAMNMLRLGMLSPDGACKAFDADADGYVRSEGIVALYVTKRSKAFRSYIEVVNTASSCDGYKPEGITYPSSSAQRELILSCIPPHIDPTAILYVEAHGTGTQAGDFEECKALDEAICAARSEKCKQGSAYEFQPLLVGSVKSNMGHCEPTSGLAGIVKVVLSFLHGAIPPNLHYNLPNLTIPALVESRLLVVTKPTPLPRNAIVGLNSFGFGGAISHAILQGEGEHPPTETDRITLAYPVSSRTPEGLEKLMEFVIAHRSNKDLLDLLSLTEHQQDHRGYVLWDKDGRVEKFQSTLDGWAQRPVWFIFAGMGTQWSGIGKDLMQYPIFAKTIEQCYRSLPSSVNNIIATGGQISLDSYSVIDEVVAICATTLGLYRLLIAVGITPAGYVGHSLGELSVCYADGCLTLEQCIQVAYWRVKCVIDAKVAEGAMGSVGLTWDETKKRCPRGVWPCCSNSERNVTVSGRKEEVEKFIEDIGQEGRFAKLVKSSGLPFHSPLMQPAVNKNTLEILRKIIPNPKKQSSKWVVTSLSSKDQKEPILCSAEFHVYSLVKPVYFHEAVQKIPKNAIIVEVGPHAILQTILKRSLSSEMTIFALQDWKQPDQSRVFMRAVGECHIAGVGSVSTMPILEPHGSSISPQTPNVSHLVAWDHSEEWFVPKSEDFLTRNKPTPNEGSVSVMGNMKSSVHPISESFTEYKVNGSSILPAAYLLLQVWKAAAQSYDQLHTSFPVRFRDLTFHDVTTTRKAPDDTTASLSILHSSISGNFELFEDGVLLLSGRVVRLSAEEESLSCSPPPAAKFKDTADFTLTKQDIYHELHLAGYQLGPHFQCLISANVNATECVVKIDATSSSTQWLAKIDALFQLAFLNCTSLSIPSYLHSLTIRPDHSETSMNLHYDTTTNDYSSAGILLKGLQLVPLEKKQPDSQLRISRYTFLPYMDILRDGNAALHMKLLIDIALENSNKPYPAVLHIIKPDVSSFQHESGASIAGHVNVVSEILQSCCPILDVRHDIVIIGESEPHLSTGFRQHPLNNRGSVSWSDSLNPTTSLSLTYDLVIAENVDHALKLCSKTGPHLLKQIAPGGFVLFTMSAETHDMASSLKKCVQRSLNDLNINFTHVASGKCSILEAELTQEFLLYRQHSQETLDLQDSEIAFVHVQDDPSTWLSELQELLVPPTPKKTCKSNRKRIYCITEKTPSILEQKSGLIGMVNCLKMESYGDRLRCVYLIDTTWEKFRKTGTWDRVKSGDLLMNIIKDGEVLGSLRHIPLEEHRPKGASSPESIVYSPSPSAKFYCKPDMTYVITGGLGGFGLELAEWLVKRGAKHLILTTRSMKYGYQARKLMKLRSQGVSIEVCKFDVSKEPEAFQLVQKASDKDGLGGIFHLAAVLEDALFEFQTVASFDTVLKPKSEGATNLDKATRSVLPNNSSVLFVVFSSVSSGFGNPGLTNYAFANSATERVCELRREDGLHGLAIQWGGVKDVGLIQKTTVDIKSIAGTSLEPVSSYLECLDSILNRKHPVLCCHHPVQLEPKVQSDSTDSHCPAQNDFKTSLCRLLGFKNPTKLRPKATLSQLGVDSLLSFEVQQLLAGNYGITLSSRELMSTELGYLIEKTSAGVERGESEESMDISSSASGTSLNTPSTLLSKNTYE